MLLFNKAQKFNSSDKKKIIGGKIMAYHKCYKCGGTEKSGRFFRRCKECGAEYCNKCSYEGQKCPECHRGFLKKP